MRATQNQTLQADDPPDLGPGNHERVQNDKTISRTIYRGKLKSSHFLPESVCRSTFECTVAMQADICRLLQAVPRSMSACMREFFQRMHTLDPQLRSLLAEWLAYHLSNFDFMWPWAKWSYVLQAPAHDAQRFALPYFRIIFMPLIIECITIKQCWKTCCPEGLAVKTTLHGSLHFSLKYTTNCQMIKSMLKEVCGQSDKGSARCKEA